MAQVKIGIYSDQVLQFIETCALFIAESDLCEVSVITQTDLSRFSESSEHRWSCTRLLADPRIQLRDRNAEPTPLDWLLIHMECHKRVRNPRLDRWVRAAGRIGCLTVPELRADLRGVVRELVRGFPYIMQARAVVLQVERGRRHPYFFVPRKAYFTPSTHPQFLTSPAYRQAMFGERPSLTPFRRFRLGFIGNRQPPERDAVLRRIRYWLERQPAIRLHEEFGPETNEPDGSLDVLWIEYGDDDSRRGLPPDRYIDALDSLDFCLCPLGWGGNWTHRVVEALLRGAIPITENEDRYNLGLIDREHCIVVHGGDWEEAVERALKLTPECIAEMRRKISTLAEHRMHPRVAARQLREQMGLPV